MKWAEETNDASAAAKAESAPIDEFFFERVYEQVARVPEGRVSTYGIIAELAGYPGKAREVGYAMSQVKPEQELHPHRIVNAKGTLAPRGVFGGQEIQRALLEAEGVTFLEEGTINLQAHLWLPAAPQEDEEPAQLSLF